MRQLGHPCATVDLPGHGASTDPRFSVRAAFDAIDEAVQGFDTPPLLVGLSLGGYTSLAYAAATVLFSLLLGLLDHRRTSSLREEAPGAYRDVHAVMRGQRELVRIQRELRPLLSYKGM